MDKVLVTPHIRCRRQTVGIMTDVAVALIPTTVVGCVIFGFSAVLTVAVAVAFAVATEVICRLIQKRPFSITDVSAVVTGLILGLSLPATTPWWQTAVGSIFAIAVVKCIFGGLGFNTVNPAICARVFMILSFPAVLTYPVPSGADTVSSGTPLGYLSSGAELGMTKLFFGVRGGCIGEVCVAALLMGAAYMLYKRVIRIHIPLAYIGTVLLLSIIFEDGDVVRGLMWTASGSCVLGAFFMASDYVSSPATAEGKLIYGAGCGALTALIRFYGGYPEGVSFAILFMNFTVPFIDALTAKTVFGTKRGGICLS